jgi:predicted dehydrogenase
MTNHPSDKLPLRGALIGFGNVAVHAHLPMWQKSSHFRIEAVVEPDPERARVARALLPEMPIYSEFESLVGGKDLDFVDICAPPCFHRDLVRKACTSGLHVFCEKPLVTSVEGLDSILQAADQFERVIFTVNNWKHAPLWTQTLNLIREGRLGTIRSISLAVLRPPQSGGGVSDWRRCAEIAGGGILLDHGWHHLYLILSILRETPLSVSARMAYSEKNGPLLEETVDLMMRFPSAEAQLHLTWRASCRQNYGTIKGDKGTLFINDDHFTLSTSGGQSARYDFPEPLSQGSQHPEWMIPVMEDFRREILHGDVRGNNLRESSLCTRLTHLAYRSYRAASLVHVSDLAL